MKEAAESLKLQEIVDNLESSLKLDAGSLSDVKPTHSNADSLETLVSLSSDLQSDPSCTEQALETKETVFHSEQMRV